MHGNLHWESFNYKQKACKSPCLSALQWGGGALLFFLSHKCLSGVVPIAGLHEVVVMMIESTSICRAMS